MTLSEEERLRRIGQAVADAHVPLSENTTLVRCTDRWLIKTNSVNNVWLDADERAALREQLVKSDSAAATWPMRVKPDGNVIAIRNLSHPEVAELTWRASDGSYLRDGQVTDWIPLAPARALPGTS